MNKIIVASVLIFSVLYVSVMSSLKNIIGANEIENYYQRLYSICMSQGTAQIISRDDKGYIDKMLMGGKIYQQVK